MRPKDQPNDKGRRSRIVECAAELIAEEGIANVTARRVAARAEVPVGSVSYYFSAQKDLLVEAAHMIARRRCDELDEWSQEITPGQVKARLSELIVRHLDEGRSLTIASYELTFAGLRDEALKESALLVASSLEDCLARFMDADEARSLAVLADGVQFTLLMKGGRVTAEDVMRYFA